MNQNMNFKKMQRGTLIDFLVKKILISMIFNIDVLSDFDPVLVFFIDLNAIKSTFFNQIAIENNLIIDIFSYQLLELITKNFKYFMFWDLA